MFERMTYDEALEWVETHRTNDIMIKTKARTPSGLVRSINRAMGYAFCNVHEVRAWLKEHWLVLAGEVPRYVVLRAL